jgi:molybdate transport system regulatory protein
MKVKVKISIVNDNDESFMGIGLIWLLGKIKELKSIRKAAIDMDMSYAKAHRILKRLEENIGQKIIITRTGGPEGGGATITPFAEELIKKYDEYQKKVKNYADDEFTRFLKELNI